MSAYNVVRFKVKPGKEQEFLDAHRKANLDLPGARRGDIIKTGDRTFCIIMEWNDMADIVAARPKMIGMLDQFRSVLEDLGGGLGLTDPVSGPVALHLM